MKKYAAILAVLVALFIVGKHMSPDDSSQPAESAPAPTQEQTPAPAPSPATPSTSSTATVSRSGQPVDPEGAGPSEPKDADALPADLASRSKLQAQQFMQAYARPPGGPNYFAWWDTVRPFLSDSAARTMNVGPSRVPFRQVQGVGAPHRGAGSELVTPVTTEVGVWDVHTVQTPDDRIEVTGMARQKPASSPSSSSRR